MGSLGTTYLSFSHRPLLYSLPVLHYHAAPPGAGAITDYVTGIAAELVQRPTGRSVSSGCRHHERSISGRTAQGGNSRFITASAAAAASYHETSISVAMGIRMELFRAGDQ